MSGNGLTVEHGLSTPSPVVAAADIALAAAAQQVVVVVDHTKIGNDTMCQTLRLDQVSTLVTDEHADARQLAPLRRAGVNIVVAPLDAEPDGAAGAFRRPAHA
jgi:DeoR/GlpR family transcriptional regulator of sugar metabolism